jgi:hypothetical protein
MSTESTYCVTIAGHLDDHWADWLGGTIVSRNTDGSTMLTIAAIDQTQLYGVLDRIRDIGASLLALHTLTPRAESPVTTAGARGPSRPSR